jgi:hypothetical protein
MSRLGLGVTTFGLQLLFSLAAWTNRGRATHTYGVGGAGRLRIVDHPTFPEHEFFRAGREFPIRVRHANVGIEDDAAKDVRALSIKFSEGPFETPLDLIMNSGEIGPFWNASSFVQFVYASLRGEPGLERYAKKYPLAWEGAADGLRRAPSTYAQITYSTMIVFRFVGTDGKVRWCRYRVIPGDRGPDSGVVTDPADAQPWLQKRFPTEAKPVDYLRREYVERLARGPVTYVLQIQLHDPAVDADPELLNSSRRWDVATHPWHDLAIVTVDRALPKEENETMRYFVGHQPESLGLWPATSVHDYHSIGHIRSRVYPWARKTRFFAYRMRGTPIEAPSPAVQPPKEEWVVTGSLVHADKREEPLHNVVVELFDRDLVFDDRLGSATTDLGGRFEIRVDMAKRKNKLDKPDLHLAVMEVEHTRDEHDLLVQKRKRVVTLPGPQDAVPMRMQGGGDAPVFAFNFGRLRVAWWEYDQSSDLPRAARSADGKLPEDWAPGYWPELVANGGLYKLLNGKHKLMAHSGDPDLTRERVQKAYDDIQECLTSKMEREAPGSTRTDEWFGFRVLNGFNPVIPRRVAGSPGEYRVELTLDDYETDGVHDVPNVDGRFEVKGGKFLPKSITIWFRETGQTRACSPTTPKVTYTPDHADWDAAKRVFRAAWNTAGEHDAHLAGCHLNMEQYAVAAYRNLRLNPVRDVLFPHLREVALINSIGDAAIFGTEGILASNTPLTADAARQRLGEHLGRLDWTGWRPRAPLCDEHQYAKVSILYWNVITQYVSEFVAEHKAEIEKHWFEVWRFSEDLVRHSFPLTLDDDWPTDWYDTNELEQGVRKGDQGDTIRAVRPITESAQAPAPGDLENLEQVLRYVIFHCTLAHTWSNDRQVEDGGEIAYGPLALYNGSIGSDDVVLPPAMEASNQLFFAHSLNAQTRGLVLQDEDKDVPKRFRDLLAAKKADFDALGFPVGRIRTRINI